MSLQKGSPLSLLRLEICHKCKSSSAILFALICAVTDGTYLDFYYFLKCPSFAHCEIITATFQQALKKPGTQTIE